MEPASKAALRERALGARLRLTIDDRRERSRAIAERVVGLPAFQRARTVAVYSALGTEVDPSDVAEAALATGRRVVYPALVPYARVLSFASCAPHELVEGPRRTRQPPPGAEPVPLGELDLVLVPGVAFDECCQRLGRGGGYYDATLAATSAVAVGLAFEVQIVPELPCEAHDRPVDAVVTELRVRFRLPGAAGGGNSRS